MDIMSLILLTGEHLSSILSINDKYKYDKMKEELGQIIKRKRIERSETLHDVAKGTDIDSPMLSKIERGVRLPTINQLKKLSEYYNFNEDELIVIFIAEKIIKEYGVNYNTYQASEIVREKISNYIVEKKNDSN